MNSTPQAVKENLAKSLIDAFETCKKNDKLDTLTDMYVQVNTISKEISICDDEEEVLTRFSFTEQFENAADDSVYKLVESLLQEAVETTPLEEAIADFDVVKPFSLLVVDENFVQQAEVYLLEAGSVVIEDSLLQNVDKELDDFLHHLLED